MSDESTRSKSRTTRLAIRQIVGWLRFCVFIGHLWSGKDSERQAQYGPRDWRGVCMTCGWVDGGNPEARRRWIVMG